ncbi:Protein Simiate [Holothuria leucospilota]|uniref:Protein Abitram n=1 Tax=Holothuria leucospilota TaxID=206669 RepID=A0A9Q0YRA5_HOLLE|nr:Protein Simiate [Holothuria leucospilota]
MADLNERDSSEEHKLFIDKYFEQSFKTVSTKEPASEFEDYCVLKHSNKVCVLTLAPGHSLLTSNKQITLVDFQITPTTNRMDNKVVGKSKKGAQWLANLSPICRVKCSDNSEYTIRSCIQGKLIEVNERLSTHPSLITEKPFTEGYIAIILPKLKKWDNEMLTLISKAEYFKVLEERKNLNLEDT